MDFDQIRENFSEDLEKDFLYLGVSVAIILVFIGAHNFVTPNERVEVGYTEVRTECYGVEAGFCIGIETREYESYNYNNYTEPEPGTENFYRRAESELMIQAYSICDDEMEGMAWASEADYRNKTGSEWLQNERVDLLPCEDTYFRGMEASS